jgi:hypothetical protein
MSNRQKIYGKGRIEGQWTGIRWEMLDSPAWKQMSYGARLFYIELLRQLSFKKYNNGRVFLSFRDAIAKMGASHRSIWIWQHEIQHYGFGEITKLGTLGPDGRATEWRLTDYGWGELDGKPIRPTREYLGWSGEIFDRNTVKGRRIGQSKNGNHVKKVKRPALRSTAHDEPQNDQKPGEAALQSTAQGQGVMPVKSTAHLDIPSPQRSVASERPIAGIGHNAGPPLIDAAASSVNSSAISKWAAPTVTELEWSAAWRRLYEGACKPAEIADTSMDMPSFLRRGHPDCYVREAAE